PSKPTPENYGALANENSKHLDDVQLSVVLMALGDKWPPAWKSAEAGKGIYTKSQIRSIIRGSRFDNLGHTPGQNLEKRYQGILNALMLSIEAKLGQSRNRSMLKWTDCHAREMSNRRKPDGLLHIASPNTSKGWEHAVVVFELKSDKHKNNDPVLTGQLLWSFIDMAKEQPRRFIVGISVSRDGDLYVNLCLPSRLYSAKVGSLPHSAGSEDSQIAAVRFLLLLYMQLPLDPGFLVGNPCGVYEPFKLSDVPDCRPLYGSDDISATVITI
ncbi:hypothetical protein EV175_006998, partial [Coemansia sp. RSA 1933]